MSLLKLRGQFFRSIPQCVFLVVLFLGGYSYSVYAQSAGTASIQGSVTDATGAVIPNASITLVDNATHVQRQVSSGTSGLYTFPNIPVGTYTLQVNMQGFQSYSQTGIVLEVGSSIAINVKMEVGSAEQKVEVRSEGLALQTEDTTFKQTIDQQTMTEMPLNGRQMTDLISSLRWFHNCAGWRFYRQQIFLPDHLCLHRRRHGQHHDVAARWWRQQRLHGQRQPSLSFPGCRQPVQRGIRGD